MIEAQELISKIRLAGYWSIRIRPTVFDRSRIQSLADCWDIVESTRVVLRGWDYPHINREERVNGDNWVQSAIDWEEYGHVELWRYYQSGQFVHYFAFLEEYHDIPWQSSEGRPTRCLDWVSALYTLSEIFEFAGRLAAREILSAEANVNIQLGNTNGRELVSWDVRDFLSRGYISPSSHIEFDRTYTATSLIADSGAAALDAAVYIFERFQWFDVPRDALAGRQRHFLERWIAT